MVIFFLCCATLSRMLTRHFIQDHLEHFRREPGKPVAADVRLTAGYDGPGWAPLVRSPPGLVTVGKAPGISVGCLYHYHYRSAYLYNKKQFDSFYIKTNI